MTFSFDLSSSARKHCRAIGWVLCAAFLLPFQPLVTFAQTPVQRDQQALAVLQQTIAAGGGQELLSSIQDLASVGTATYYLSDPVTASVTIKSRGSRQFRDDVVMPDGQRSTVVDGDGGLQVEPNGALLPVSSQSAFDLRCMVFPYSPLIAAIQSPSINVIYIGLVNHNGASVYDIRLQQTFAADQNSQGNRSAREAHDFYIDPNTFLVVAVSDQFYSSATGSEGISHEIQFSNYQAEGGVALPLTIVETVDGTTAVTMQLNQVNFNSGLTDSDFSL